jgi:predicted PurR-regulated permease PerM
MATNERRLAPLPPPERPDRTDSPRGPHLWEVQAVVDLVIILAAGLVLWFVYELRGVFLPVLTALGLAYLFNPPITAAQTRWGMPRVLTISLLLVTLTAAGAAFLAWLGPLLVQQAQALAQKTPQYMQTLGERYGIQSNTLSLQILSWTAQLRDDPVSVLQSVFQPLFAGTGHALGFIGAVIGTTTYIAITAMLLPLYFFVFAWRFDQIAESVSRLIPASRRARTWEILGKIDEAITGFFHGRLLIAAVTAVMYAAGWVWTDVPYWFLLGLGTGLLSIIPYVSVIGWPLAILLKYLDAAAGAGGPPINWISIALLPSIPYLIVQFLESWWLTPWIQGRTNDLSAVTVIIVVLIGGAMGGILGLMLAIPIAASVKILFLELLLPRWEAWAARR